jgi:GNAT superfamily N-acetyltransferase
MQAQIHHRWLEADDGPAVLRVHRRAILLDGVRAYSPAMVRSWADEMTADYAGRCQRSGETIELAEMHGAVVGFCGVQDDEIAGLFVDPGFTGRGIARGLTERALKRMRAAGHDQARVTAALSGVGFYEAVGFRPVRGVRHPTRGGMVVPVLEMTRALEREEEAWSSGPPGPLAMLATRSAGAAV